MADKEVQELCHLQGDRLDLVTKALELRKHLSANQYIPNLADFYPTTIQQYEIFAFNLYGTIPERLKNNEDECMMWFFEQDLLHRPQVSRFLTHDQPFCRSILNKIANKINSLEAAQLFTEALKYFLPITGLWEACLEDCRQQLANRQPDTASLDPSAQELLLPPYMQSTLTIFAQSHLTHSHKPLFPVITCETLPMILEISRICVYTLIYTHLAPNIHLQHLLAMSSSQQIMQYFFQKMKRLYQQTQQTAGPQPSHSLYSNNHNNPSNNAAQGMMMLISQKSLSELFFSLTQRPVLTPLATRTLSTRGGNNNNRIKSFYFLPSVNGHHQQQGGGMTGVQPTMMTISFHTIAESHPPSHGHHHMPSSTKVIVATAGAASGSSNAGSYRVHLTEDALYLFTVPPPLPPSPPATTASSSINTATLAAGNSHSNSSAGSILRSLQQQPQPPSHQQQQLQSHLASSSIADAAMSGSKLAMCIPLQHLFLLRDHQVSHHRHHPFYASQYQGIDHLFTLLHNNGHADNDGSDEDGEKDDEGIGEAKKSLVPVIHYTYCTVAVPIVTVPAVSGPTVTGSAASSNSKKSATASVAAAEKAITMSVPIPTSVSYHPTVQLDLFVPPSLPTIGHSSHASNSRSGSMMLTAGQMYQLSETWYDALEAQIFTCQEQELQLQLQIAADQPLPAGESKDQQMTSMAASLGFLEPVSTVMKAGSGSMPPPPPPSRNQSILMQQPPLPPPPPPPVPSSHSSRAASMIQPAAAAKE